MIEVYRGSPNAWECDEMSHMNVRFYLAKLMEAIGVFCYETGMPHAFKINAPSTVLLKDLHIRFLKEAQAGAPLLMHAGVIEVSDSSAKIYMQLDHLDGAPCAVFRFELDHIDIHTRQAFLWSPKTVDKFKNSPAIMPEGLGPRSISLDSPSNPPPTMDDVEKVGSIRIGTGIVLPEQCNIFGQMKTEFFIARLSDSAPHLTDALNIGMTWSPKPSGTTQRIGTAALEYKFIFHNRPVAGDSFHIYAGLAQVSSKTWSTYYWIMNPHSGQTYATAQATLIRFDLDTRKSVAQPKDVVEAIEKSIPQGMWL